MSYTIGWSFAVGTGFVATWSRSPFWFLRSLPQRLRSLASLSQRPLRLLARSTMTRMTMDTAVATMGIPAPCQSLAPCPSRPWLHSAPSASRPWIAAVAWRWSRRPDPARVKVRGGACSSPYHTYIHIGDLDFFAYVLWVYPNGSETQTNVNPTQVRVLIFFLAFIRIFSILLLIVFKSYAHSSLYFSKYCQKSPSFDFFDFRHCPSYIFCKCTSFSAFCFWKIY